MVQSIENQAGSLPRRTTRLRIFCLFLILSFLTIGCAATGAPGQAVPPEELPPYNLKLVQTEKPKPSTDGYEVILRFNLHSTQPFPYRFLVQEITQITTFYSEEGYLSQSAITLVEVFRLSGSPTRTGNGYVYSLFPFQRDRHFEEGFAKHSKGRFNRIEVERNVRLYAAEVQGADFTALGFAHLSKNRSGEVVTDIPKNFNRRYQDNHETRGSILVDDREGGSVFYVIRYTWTRSSDGVICARIAEPEIIEDPAAPPSATGGEPIRVPVQGE